MNSQQRPAFIGVDLGWYGKPSGLAVFRWVGRKLSLGEVTRLSDELDILNWIAKTAKADLAVVAVDAPTIILNEGGIRPAERALNAMFRRFHAGCHPANLARPSLNTFCDSAPNCSRWGSHSNRRWRRKRRGASKLKCTRMQRA
jgi:predicted RNase H-like nuclease